jgi:hypothetical protein
VTHPFAQVSHPKPCACYWGGSLSESGGSCLPSYSLCSTDQSLPLSESEPWTSGHSWRQGVSTGGRKGGCGWVYRAFLAEGAFKVTWASSPHVPPPPSRLLRASTSPSSQLDTVVHLLCYLSCQELHLAATRLGSGWSRCPEY